MPKQILRSDVLKFEDLKEGMVLNGTVRNVIDFGAFVDIGVKHDGLVHISEMSNNYVKNPSEIVSVGDIVKVKVIGIDNEKQKVKLSMKIKDNTKPDIDISAVARQNNLKGLFVKEILNEMENSNIDKNTLENVLEIGLDILEK